MSGEHYCQAPGVLPLTDCLPNTAGRCTWCGRKLPPMPRQSPPPLPASLRATGTDPVAYLGDAREEET